MTPARSDSIPRWAAWVDVPSPKDALVGNIATEKVIEALTARGAYRSAAVKAARCVAAGDD